MADGGSSGASYRWQSTFLDGSAGAAQVAPSADNNKGPILEVLRRRLPALGAGGRVLEVASGTGQHVAHFAAALPGLEWTPSDATPELFPSIAAHTAAAGATNVARPVVLDATWPPEQWRRALQEGSGAEAVFNAVVVANLTHISPWRATLGLLGGAAAVLAPGGRLAIYGPFKLRGAFTTASNRAFHERLLASNPEWGYRDTADIEEAASRQGLALVAVEDMPANNHYLWFEKGSNAAPAAANV
ncbi:hypothetical protein Rsub_11926 [Raphidocelis subcapitata]|uniref:SAM-dependent methyltransferase n=1 Tax=Raphidocelis subcapitata TaxID=307507 RepID=A0A2V0PND6_9CHLO|nr:hypothetical protein Rsub_11926 [Raphidocelis subcapitata]|eukprot:GBF99440.1 hypothetical protein Rsub_11926 [Raphidocelis subcapitata]